MVALFPHRNLPMSPIRATLLSAALLTLSGAGVFVLAQPAPDAVLPDGAHYVGELRDGLLQGQGRLEWRNGDRYEGGFENGRMHGAGRLTLADGTRYRGEFAHGRRAGQGWMQLPDGSVYEGEFRDDLFHGRGSLQLPDGRRYEGEFRHGRFHGQGRLESPAETYVGAFQYGHYHGVGEISYVDGERYRGEFAFGRPHGRGQYQAEGESYEGEFEHGSFSGEGRHTDEHGSVYQGRFKDWRYHGAGRYTDPDGNVYEGRFESGELRGPGRYAGVDGESYEGDFSNWRFDGRGTLRLANGDVYEGEFRYGQYHGQGTLSLGAPRADGQQRLTGVWRHGRLQNAPEQDPGPAKVERALLTQGALLEQALAGLRAGEPGRIELYLLALAGDGKQEVFRREVEFVRRQFDADFGTQGRSLTLINSRNTMDSAPMATVLNLQAALKALGRQMNPDEDVLFLFLTSHGSAEHELVLDQNDMNIRGLPAAKLGELLRESGIRWKVVVVSACYSGGFIDHLKDDHTLVITAARHDRTSFGCADENEFTYFGRAFFKEALPKSASFWEAFGKAEVLVKLWEEAMPKRGEVQHSLPQMHAPPAVLEHLQRWRTQSAQAPAASVASRAR